MGKPDGKGGGQAAADPRFAAMHKDPRFQRFPKNENKLVVDKRFSAMFEDPDFQSRSAVDKRGRKVEARRASEDLRRYYRLRDEDEWRQDDGGGEGAVAPSELPPDGQPTLQKQQGAAPEKAEGGKGKAAQAAAEETLGMSKEGQKNSFRVANAENGGHGGEGSAEPRIAKRQRAGGAAPAPVRGARGNDANGWKGKAGTAPAAVGRAKTKGSGAACVGIFDGEENGDLERLKMASESVDDEEDDDDDDDGTEQDEQSDDADGKEDGDLQPDVDEEPREQENEGGEEQEEEEEQEDARARERWAKARGMMGSDSSDEDADGDEEPDSADEPLTDEEYESDEQLDPEEWGVGADALNPDEAIPQQEESRRLALVDLDWDHVRAVDILAVLRSFLPRGGSLGRVTVFPSDYGLQRMAEEAAAGPKLILKPSQRDARASKTASGAAGGKDGRKKADKQRQGMTGDDDGAEVDKKRLAAYEKSKLRYYYAVVECDCIATALHLYNECDGMEFERSACKFDMRFVPDDQSFKGRQIRDTATEVPAGYEPPAHFNISLQHTDPKLSWDAEDPERKRKLQGRRLKTDEALLEADFAAYLGSEDDEDDEEDALLLEQHEDHEEAAAAGAGRQQKQQEAAWASGGAGLGNPPGAAKGSRKEDAEALRRRYRALLLGDVAADADQGGKGRVGGKSWLGSEDGEEVPDDEGQAVIQVCGRGTAGEPSTSGRSGGASAGRKGDVDMVVTFHSGLEGLGERLKKKKEEERARAGETVWEAYLRKKREKRALRKAQGRLRNLSDSDDSDDYISDGDGDAGGKGKKAHKALAMDSDNDDGDVPSDDAFFQHDEGDDPFSDPFFNRDGAGANAAAASEGNDTDGGPSTEPDGLARRATKRKEESSAKSKKARKGERTGDKAASASERADLELLLMDDAALRDAARGVKTRVLPAAHDDGAAASKRGLTKKEMREIRKEARRKAREGSDDEDAAGGAQEDGSGFAVNLSDPRFVDMFQSAEFALDPTDPRFQKMQARDQVLMELQKRRAQQPAHVKPGNPKNGQQQNAASAVAESGAADELQQQRGAGSDLRIMVAKLKRKAEVQQEKDRAQALGKGHKKARL